LLRFFIFVMLVVVGFSAKAAAFKPVLNLLAPIGVLSPKIISQFEEETHSNVRIEFVGSRFEYESRLRAGLRNYDVVLSDERILQRLYLQRQLRTLNDEAIFAGNISSTYPLQTKSRLNADGRSYLTLMADPMGIAFNKKNFLLKHAQVSWDWLISPDENPYWRQRVFVSNFPKHQLLLALLATGKEITTSSWFIPEPTIKWLQSLKLQSANIDYPLELAFLGNKIEAAVVFRSDFLKLKKVVPDLKFAVPSKVTYYDRIGAAIVSDTVQEALAQNFVKFLNHKKDNLIVNDNYLSYNTLNYEGSATKNWVPYDDDIPLPRRIENILNDFYKK
jgi:ABC-type molybdate transport system substrate-binding protein